MMYMQDPLLTDDQDLANKTLQWLKDQQVEATPEHYTVGYEHLRGKNPSLSYRLSTVTDKGEDLSKHLIQLYQEFFDEGDSGQLDQLRDSLQQILQLAISITSKPQAEARHFQKTLEKSRQMLTADKGLDSVLNVVNSLVSETQRMDNALTTMEQDLRQTSDEVSILKEQYDQVRHEVFNDPLTSVLNRRGLDSALRRLIVNSEHKLQLSMLMIDLDNFKPFNDKHGHLVGDQVLCFAAKILKNITRGSDLIARYGGDEFAILLPNTGEKEAKAVAHNILEAFRNNTIKRRSNGIILGTLSASIGVAELAANETAEELIERADRCLYASKNKGRDQVT